MHSRRGLIIFQWCHAAVLLGFEGTQREYGIPVYSSSSTLRTRWRNSLNLKGNLFSLFIVKSEFRGEFRLLIGH